MAEELPLFIGLNDKTVTEIPKTVEKQRFMTSVAPKAANPGKWVEMPRMPIPTGEHAVIECGGKIHSIAGYAKHRVDQNFHQVYDPASKSWSLMAPFPHPCNHVAGVSIGTKIYTFGGFVEQNRCPHSKCFVYDTATDQWAPIAGLSRPRGAISAIALDGKIHLLGGRDVRSVEWHEVYDPAANKYADLAGMRGSTGTQPFVGQRDHMGVAVVDGKIHAIAGRMDSYDFNTSLNAVYDPKTDGWSFRAPLPTARSGPSCVYINGKIVVFGGEATRQGVRHQRGLRPEDRQLGGAHAHGNPPPRLAWRDLRGDRQHGARARRRSGTRRQRPGRLSRRLHLRLTPTIVPALFFRQRLHGGE